MAKHTIKGFVTMQPPYEWAPEQGPRISFYTFDPRTSGWEGAIVCEHSFEIEIPENFDPRPAMVEALQAQKDAARREYAAKVVELDQRIQSLLALEMSPESAA